MRTGVERGNRTGRVQTVWRADANGIGFDRLQHLIVVGKGLVDAILFAAAFNGLGHHVRSGDHFDVFHFLKIAHMRPGNTASTDKGDAQFLLRLTHFLPRFLCNKR